MKVYILSEEVGRQIVIALELGKNGRRKSRDALGEMVLRGFAALEATK